MGGGGRRSSSRKESQPQQQQYYQPQQQQNDDKSMQIWASEMDKQRQLQQKQYDDMRKQYEDQRKLEDARIAAENAKREQELWNEKQMAKDKEAIDQYKTTSQAYAGQIAGDPTADSTTSAINKKIGDSSKSSAPAPGLTPFGTSVIKPANMIYQGSQARFGGL